MEGILVLDKPSGFTSFDVVAVLRGLSRQKKIGHTGTLDPLATGVLPLLFGRATRAAALLPDTSKEYEASFQLGYATDTQDRTGKETARSERKATESEIQSLLPQFTGEIWQIPPMYSAVSVKGRRLYELARQGIEIEREKRRIAIDSLELLDFNQKDQSGSLRISCSGGTYVRTLLHDLGQALGTCAVMTELRRTRACGFSLPAALSLDKAKELAAAGKLEGAALPVDRLFRPYPAVRVTLKQAVRFSNGGALALSRITMGRTEDNALVRVYAPDERFLGLGRVRPERDELTVERLFVIPVLDKQEQTETN